MIPKDKEKTINNVTELLGKQQNRIVYLRNKTRPERFSEKIKPARGDCFCCGKKNIIIVKIKEQLCDRCFNWCKRWIISQKGYYTRLLLPDAVAEFHKPIPCRFKNVCGNDIKRVKDDGTVSYKKSNVCNACMPIYVNGLQIGSKKRRTQFIRRTQNRRDIDE